LALLALFSVGVNISMLSAGSLKLAVAVSMGDSEVRRLILSSPSWREAYARLFPMTHIGVGFSLLQCVCWRAEGFSG